LFHQAVRDLDPDAQRGEHFNMAMKNTLMKFNLKLESKIVIFWL